MDDDGFIECQHLDPAAFLWLNMTELESEVLQTSIQCRFKRIQTPVSAVNRFAFINNHIPLVRLKCKAGENMTQKERRRRKRSSQESKA